MQQRITLDFETKDPHLITLGSASRHPGFLEVITCGFEHHETGKSFTLQKIEDICEEVNNAKELVMHNAQYDACILQSLGVDLRDKTIIDTANLAQLTNPFNIQQKSSLAYLSSTYLKEQKTQGSLGDFVIEADLYRDQNGKSSILKKNAANYTKATNFAYKNLDLLYRVDPTVVDKYCIQDVNLTTKLYNLFLPQTFINEESEQWIEVLSNVNKQFINMQHNGVYLDYKKLTEFRAQLIQQELDLQHELFSMLRITNGNPKHLNSPKYMPNFLQMLNIKYDLTKTGRPSITKAWMLTHTHPFLRLLSKYRSHMKFRNTYCDFPLEYQAAYKIPVIDGLIKIHPNYKILAALTGRTSASKPNIQNIPNENKEVAHSAILREMFAVPHDKVLCVGDVDQQELRIFADGCNKAGMKRLKEKYDIDPTIDFHTFVAKEILHIERKPAKAINFGLLYGKGLKALAVALELSVEEAEPIIKHYQREFPEMEEFKKALTHVYSRRGYVVVDGRRLVVEPKRYSAQLRRWLSYEYRLVNYYCQSRGVNQIYFTMSELYKRGITPYMEVHDELAFLFDTAKIDDRMDYIRPIKQIMETVLPCKIPLLVSFNAGRNWKDAKPS